MLSLFMLVYYLFPTEGIGLFWIGAVVGILQYVQRKGNWAYCIGMWRYAQYPKYAIKRYNT